MTGLPPKSPVYAVVNKSAKANRVAAQAKAMCSTTSSPQHSRIMFNRSISESPTRRQVISQQQQKAMNPQHNYCNIGPSLGDLVHGEGPVYENTRAVLQRLELDPPKRQEQPQESCDSSNYMTMNPRHSSGESNSLEFPQLPLIPFEPFDQQGVMQPYPCDSINRKLREFHDSLNPEEPVQYQNMPLPPVPAHNSVAANKSKSIDDLQSSEMAGGRYKSILGPKASEDFSNSTIPRSSKGGDGVSMRRSASVPCKRPSAGNRGSTSSSDSGFSAGSPSNTATHGKGPVANNEPVPENEGESENSGQGSGEDVVAQSDPTEAVIAAPPDSFDESIASIQTEETTSV